MNYSYNVCSDYKNQKEMNNPRQIEQISVEEMIALLSDNELVEVYTDGACKGNPGPGGWGAVLLYKNKRAIMFGNEQRTTNNRMELKAAIEALKSLPTNIKINLYTDSTYLKNGMRIWLDKWKLNNWKTINNSPIKNIDLWQTLDTINSSHNITWEWVKGHSQCLNNNNADYIARSAINQII